MSFVAALGLVLTLIIRPQEIWPFLNVFRLLDVFTGLAVLGVAFEFATGKQKQPWSPQLPFLAALTLIGYACTVKVMGRPGLTTVFQRMVITGLFMLAIMYGARTFARLRALLVLLVVIMGFVSAVAVHQGRQEPQCVEIPIDDATGQRVSIEDGNPDGRSCDTAFSCEKGGKEKMDYKCEKLGLFKTASTGGRVKWRGQLGDPNELSVYIGACLPLLLALTTFMKNKAFTLFALAILGVWLWAVILTQSRGGQLVIGAVFATYFVSRFGAKGVIAGIVMALPVMLLGGRENADDSSAERLELLYEGMTVIKQNPIFGIGIDRFTETNWLGLTAHNSYVLSAAETGMPGFFAWTGLLWASVKIPLKVVRNPPPEMDPRLKPFAMAFLVSFIGMCIGIFFLSFTFKQLLFVWFGMAGALYGVVRKDSPQFEVKFGKWDYIGIVGFCVGLMTLVFVYTRIKGTG